MVEEVEEAAAQRTACARADVIVVVDDAVSVSAAVGEQASAPSPALDTDALASTALPASSSSTSLRRERALWRLFSVAA